MNNESNRRTFSGQVLVEGKASGEALVLDEALSLWGGLDPTNGEIIDKRHPQSGVRVTGRILLLPSGRGSSSASSILLEAVRAKTAPAAILMQETDGILALGATVAKEIYDADLPVIVLAEEMYVQITDGDFVTVADASVTIG